MFKFKAMGLYSDSASNSFFMYDGFSGILGLGAQVTDTVSVSKDIQWWDNDSWRVIGNVNWDVASGCRDRVFHVVDALQDQLAAPALLDPFDIGPGQPRIELLRRPGRQRREVGDILGVAAASSTMTWLN